MTLHTTSPWKIGLMQAAIVLCYIVLFTVALQNIGGMFHDTPDNPFVAMPIVLTVFVFSALVCGSAILGYPLVLLSEKNIRRAVAVVCWSAAWLGMFLVTAIVIAVGTRL